MTVEVKQKASEWALDGRPMFEAEAVAIYHVEQGRMVIALYGPGVIMAVPLTPKGAQALYDSIKQFLENPTMTPHWKGIVQ